MIKIINEVEEFNEEITKTQNILVDFFATWCGPCQMLSPILEKFSELHRDITVLKIDIDKMRELAIKYEIEFVPTLIFIKNGQTIRSTSGVLSNSELEEFIK